MGFNRVKRLLRTSFATLHPGWPGLQAHGVFLCKYRPLLRRLPLVGSKGKGVRTRSLKRKWMNFRLKKSGVIFKCKKCPETAGQTIKSAEVAVRLGAVMVNHNIEFTDTVSLDCATKARNTEENPSADRSSAISACSVVVAEGSLRDASSLEPPFISLSFNVTGQPLENSHLSCALVEEADPQTVHCSSISQPRPKKRLRSVSKCQRRAPVLLTRHRKLSKFDLQFWCRVRSAFSGSCRKGRRAQNMARISTHRDNSVASRASTGEGERPTRKAPRPGQGAEPRERALQFCHSGGPKCRLQVEGSDLPGAGQKHRAGLKQALPANGIPAGWGEDEGGGSPLPRPAHSGTPLQDHHYCRATTGGPKSAMGRESLHTKEAVAPGDQLLPKEVTNEAIKGLIREFLEHFYRKHGSLILLSKSDILMHLNRKLNTDLQDRKSLISTEVTKYQAALARAPLHCFRVAYNKHILTPEDLSTLDNQNWVNDQVINMYGELIMEAVNHKVHFFNSFFHRQLVTKGYDGVKRWTKKVDLFTKKLLLIPIHLEIHWSLITVDISSQNIHFYDSQGLASRHAIENILRYITAEAKEKKRTAFQQGWKVIVNKYIPQQRNDNDCGVFVLEYCKCLALGKPLRFSQGDMPEIRKRIYKELCDCRLTE